MIIVQDQYAFKCSVSDRSDFIDPENLLFFEIVESCGVMVPFFKLMFLTNDESLVTKLHEGQTLNVQFGRSVDNLEEMALSCSKILEKRVGAGVLEFTISGFLNRNNFLSMPKKKIASKMTSLQAVKETVSVHFKPKFNVESSDDVMNWVQYNTTDRNFVFDTLMHAYKPATFFASAICTNGDFVVKDMREEIRLKSRKPDWLFSNSDKNGALNYSGDYQVQSMHGYVNHIATYGYSMDWHSPELGTKETFTQEAEVILSLSKSIAKKADVEKRYFGTQMQNANVHSNFWRAYQQNIVGLLGLSTVKVALPLASSYALVRPLDIVMFKDTSLESPDVSNEQHSGIYVVSRVKKGISGKIAFMSVEICREAFNGVRNAT